MQSLEEPSPSNENLENSENQPPKSKKIKKNHSKIDFKWVFYVFLMSFSLGATFSILSELLLEDASILAVIIVLTSLLFINIIFDCIGLAFATAKPEPFLAMASKNVWGAKKAVKLLKNSNKVSSFCQDIMGDICGIISGAAGATAVVVIAGNADVTTVLIVSAIISGVIASTTIAGKAATKKIAMNSSTSIVMLVSRILSRKEKTKKINKNK